MSGNNSGGTGDAEFDAFESSGTVEIGDSDKSVTTDENEDEGKASKRRGPPREAAKSEAKASTNADDEDEDGEGGDEDENEDEDGEKPKKSARDHQIERLKREKSELNRRLRALEGGAGTAGLQARLDALEKSLPDGKGNDTKTAGTPAPDPSDTAKYPLGHLDDRYIEDKIEWIAEDKATKQADAVLQREQESEQTRRAQAAQADLLEKVDTLATKGSELFEDFQESVVEAGMRGDWKLSQTTFEAAHDADNGAQILYELSQDPKEALRVSKLSPIQQLRFVLDRDTAIGTGKKGRTKPQAGEPPKNQARGANSKTQGNPATDDLNDFEKQWEREAKKSK